MQTVRWSRWAKFVIYLFLSLDCILWFYCFKCYVNLLYICVSLLHGQTPLKTDKQHVQLSFNFCLYFLFLFFNAGDHPEDSGHPQSALDFLFWPSPQQQPIQRPGALAPPRYGRVSHQREIWTSSAQWGMEVRKSFCVWVHHSALCCLDSCSHATLI